MTNCLTSYVDEHTWGVVTCANNIANRKKTLLTHWKLSKIVLWRDFGLKEMTNLSFIEFFYAFRTTAQLHLAERILLGGRFYLYHLNTIKQHDRHRHCLAPLIVHCCHSQFYTKSTHTPKSFSSFKFREFGEAGSWSCF